MLILSSHCVAVVAGHRLDARRPEQATADPRRFADRDRARVPAAVVALVPPKPAGCVTPGTFLRIPLEGLVVGLGLLLPPRWRRILAGVAGAAFAVLTIVKLLNLGFFFELDRPFNPIDDWASSGPVVHWAGNSGPSSPSSPRYSSSCRYSCS